MTSEDEADGGVASLEGFEGILRAGKLAGLAPEPLAEMFGTPFYVYDLDLIERRVNALRAILPAGFRIAFSRARRPVTPR